MPLPTQETITYTDDGGGNTTSIAIDGLNGSAGSEVDLDFEGIVVDGGGTKIPLYVTNSSYLNIHNLTCHNSSGHVISLDGADYINLSEVIGYNAATGNYNIFGVHGSEYCKLVDCAGWGEARKVYSNSQGGDHCIIERCFGRFDEYTGVQSPLLVYTIAYNSYYGQIKDCIGTVAEGKTVDAIFGADREDAEDASHSRYERCLAYGTGFTVSSSSFWRNDVPDIQLLEAMDAVDGRVVNQSTLADLYYVWESSPILARCLALGVDILGGIRALLEPPGADKSLKTYSYFSPATLGPVRKRGETVYSFASAAARNARYTAPRDGLVVENQALRCLQVYDATNGVWRPRGEHPIKLMRPSYWWRAATGHALADGSECASWKDEIAGVSVAEATNKPVFDQDGIFGRESFSFDGTLDKLSVAAASLTFSATDFSVAVLCRCYFAGTDFIVAQYDSGANERAWAISHHSTGWYVNLSADGTGATKSRYDLTQIDDNTPHLLAFTFTGGALTLYLDGVASSMTGDDGEMASINVSTEPMTFGCGLNSGAVLNPFEGRISDVVIFNRGLTASEHANVADALGCL